MNKKYKDFFLNYFNDLELLLKSTEFEKINSIVLNLINLRKKNGRVFFLGVGGSAANCSHAVNDFRKLCNIKAYTAVDNVAELTARINDEGWDQSFVNWLKIFKVNNKDAVFIFSVGGGDLKKKVSVNIIRAIEYAKKRKCRIFSILGRKNSYTYKNSNICILAKTTNKKLITPLSESYQAIIWHCIISHPSLKANRTKW
jgi:D-sedoheptulose 7-phosphate isomerase